jgi:hypothetical protein
MIAAVFEVRAAHFPQRKPRLCRRSFKPRIDRHQAAVTPLIGFGTPHGFAGPIRDASHPICNPLITEPSLVTNDGRDVLFPNR